MYFNNFAKKKNYSYLVIKLLIIVILLYLVENVYSKPYGLRDSKKTVQFDTTIEFNYLFIDHESFVQFALIEELTFGKIDLGFGIYLPLSINNEYVVRPIHYNSLYGLLGLLYYIQYGKYEANPAAIKVSEIKDFTLGSGFILERYYNTMSFPEIRKIGLDFEFRKWGVVFDGIIGELATQNIIGGRIALNTGKILNTTNIVLNSLEIGFTGVVDIYPKQLSTVRIFDRVRHKIVLNRASGDKALYILGGDLSFNFYKTQKVVLGLYVDGGYMSLGGYGVGYGLNLWGYPVADLSFEINYKMQILHSFEGFVPSYFNSIYDYEKRSKRDLLDTKEKQHEVGIKAELGFYFFNKRISLKLAYADYNLADGLARPHFLVKLSVVNIPKRFYTTITYEDYSFTFPNIGNVRHRGSHFLIEILYGFTPLMEFGFSTRKNFIIQDFGNTQGTDTLLTISVFGKILF